MDIKKIGYFKGNVKGKLSRNERRWRMTGRSEKKITNTEKERTIIKKTLVDTDR